MVSEARAIELTVVSATDLKKVKKFNHQRCYVVAYIYSAQRQATQVDNIGGVNPIWNAPLLFKCYETDLHPDGSSHSNASSSSSSSSSRAITIDIYSHTNGIFSSGGKLVGSVVVPLRHVASVAQVEGLSIMALDVRRPSGKIQGKINLTVKLGEKHAIARDHRQQASSYAYHRYKVGTSPQMPPAVTSYNAVSGALSNQGVYNPKLNTPGNQEIVTGYPAPGYGFAPLGQLSAPNPREVYQTRSNVQAPRSSTRLFGRRGQRMTTLSRADQTARRKKHLARDALIAGGLIFSIIFLE